MQSHRHAEIPSPVLQQESAVGKVVVEETALLHLEVAGQRPVDALLRYGALGDEHGLLRILARAEPHPESTAAGLRLPCPVVERLTGIPHGNLLYLVRHGLDVVLGMLVGERLGDSHPVDGFLVIPIEVVGSQIIEFPRHSHPLAEQALLLRRRINPYLP